VSGPQPTIAQLRPALQFALDAAKIGSGTLPGRVRSVVRARRLPPNWAATIRQVLEEDDEYRQTVAAEASEEELGRLSWLWLARPEGWADELDGLVETAAEESEKERALRQALGRIADLEKELSVAVAAREDAIAEAGKARRSAAESRKRVQELSSLTAEQASKLEGLQGRLVEVEQEIASVDRIRLELAEARAARVGAEEALRAALARAETAESRSRAVDEQKAFDERTRSEITGSIGAAVSRAAEASDSLGAAMREVASLLGFAPPTQDPSGFDEDPVVVPGRGPKRPRPGRSPLRLPPAVLEDTPEAAAYLVRASGVHLVVDGYNVTFRSWAGEDLPSLRHRLVSALSELSLRYRLPVTVVFDGADAGGMVPAPPAARMLLRILFSASDVEADAVILETVRSLPPRTPVVVATDDREVRQAASGLGANVLSVGQLLNVIGRQAGGPGR
jgi:predicted RNA-binding protein with PIN domain